MPWAFVLADDHLALAPLVGEDDLGGLDGALPGGRVGERLGIVLADDIPAVNFVGIRDDDQSRPSIAKVLEPPLESAENPVPTDRQGRSRWALSRGPLPAP